MSISDTIQVTFTEPDGVAVSVTDRFFPELVASNLNIASIMLIWGKLLESIKQDEDWKSVVTRKFEIPGIGSFSLFEAGMLLIGVSKLRSLKTPESFMRNEAFKNQYEVISQAYLHYKLSTCEEG